MPGPKINDDFWFSFSEGYVNRAQETQEKAAEKLQNLVLWLWGIYTTFTAIGFALAQKGLDFWPTLLISAASASLIAVYWSAVWVSVPLFVEFDPRSPTEIAKAYGDSTRKRAERLKFTVILSIAAIFLVSLSLMVASVAKEPKAPKPPALAASAKVMAGQTHVAVTAAVGNTTEARIDVLGAAGESLTGHGLEPYLPTDDGQIQTSIALPGNLDKVSVVVEWNDSNGMTIRLSKTIDVEKSSAVKQSRVSRSSRS